MPAQNATAPDLRREALLARLRKLRAMTLANGCSEAEASTAAGLLAALMAQHQVADTELSVRRAMPGCTTDSFEEFTKGLQDWARCSPAIARLFHTKVWYSTHCEDVLGLGIDTEFLRVSFFGLPEDVAASVTMLAICNSALSTETALWLKTSRPPGLKLALARDSFRAGMIARLGERIDGLRPQAAPSGGTALLVLKDQLVTQEFARLGLHLRSRPVRTREHDARAYAAGQSAGGRVRLGASAEVAGGQRRISA